MGKKVFVAPYAASTVANLLNVSPQHLAKLARDGVVAKVERGRYDLVASVRGYIEYLQTRSAGSDSPATDLQAERSRLTKAKADRAELEASQMRGDLIPVAQIDRHWQSAAAVIRTRMLAIPPKMAAVIYEAESPSDVMELLMDEVRDALEELSGNGRAANDSSLDAEAVSELVEGADTSAESKNVGVG